MNMALEMRRESKDQIHVTFQVKDIGIGDKR